MINNLHLLIISITKYLCYIFQTCRVGLVFHFHLLYQLEAEIDPEPRFPCSASTTTTLNSFQTELVTGFSPSESRKVKGQAGLEALHLLHREQPPLQVPCIFQKVAVSSAGASTAFLTALKCCEKHTICLSPSIWPAWSFQYEQ